MSKIVVAFVRRSDWQVFRIDDAPIGLTGAKGLDTPNVEVFTQKAAVGDGDLVTGQRVGSRTIEFTASVRNVALNDIIRRSATSFFTAGRTYDVHVARYGGQRYAAECRLDSIDVPTENQYNPITIKISMLMPDGYWLSADSYGKNIAGVDPRCGYPFISLSGYGRIYGVYAQAGTVYLENDGDAEAYCRAVFTAQGDVTNPKLLTGNGYVRVLCAMHAGDVLIIDAKSKSVTLNGVNVAMLLDKTSSFSGIVFAIGTNAVGFAADVGSSALAVNVYYNKRYLGT